MTAARERSVDEIVAAYDRDYRNGLTFMPSNQIRAIIADWRARGAEIERLTNMLERLTVEIHAGPLPPTPLLR